MEYFLRLKLDDLLPGSTIKTDINGKITTILLINSYQKILFTPKTELCYDIEVTQEFHAKNGKIWTPEFVIYDEWDNAIWKQITSLRIDEVVIKIETSILKEFFKFFILNTNSWLLLLFFLPNVINNIIMEYAKNDILEWMYLIELFLIPERLIALRNKNENCKKRIYQFIKQAKLKTHCRKRKL